MREGRALRLVGAHIDITDRKLAEQAVRESEQRFRLVSESAPVMLWMGDVQGKCLYLNRMLREFWGVAPRGRAGLRLERVAASRRSRRRSIAVFGQAMREHAPFTVEARYRRADGEYRLVRTDAQPRFDAGGEFLGMIGVNVDITETRRAEQALKESEERFRLIANSAPVPMWVSRLDGKRAFVNQAYMDFLGLGYEECLVFDWRKALHPDDLAAHPAASRSQARAPRSRSRCEARYRRGDGQWRWLRSESQPRWGPDGEHIGFIGVAHDITAAKQAEIELRGLNETLEAQVEARTRERDRIWNVSQDMLVVADSRRRVAQRQSGRDGDAGLEPGRAARPDLGVDRASRRHRADASGGGASGRRRHDQRFENRLRHKDGSYRWLSWTAASHEGLIYAVARDVTDEKEAAETLRRTEEALRQSQKMEAVGQLTGGIAHDFNNLLQGIIGSLDLVQKRLADGRLGEIQRYVNGAMTSANRAAALTHRLLAFSRRQPLDPKPVKRQPADCVHGGPAAPHHGREDRARAGAGRRPVADALRPEPAREQHPQPGHQRPRCHARRRQAHDRDLQRRISTTPTPPRERDVDARRVRLHRRHRHRHRHDARRDGARLRSRSSPPSRRARARASACR